MTKAGRPVVRIARYQRIEDGDDRHHDLHQSPAERASHLGSVAAARAPASAPPRPGKEPPDVGRRLHEPRFAPELGAAGAGRRHRGQLEDATRGGGEDQHAVRQEHRLVDVMRHEQDRLGPPGELLAEPLAELLPLHLVEGRERLVHQQHGRIVGQRARDVDSLEHAAREVVRPLLLVPSEPELPQELAGGEARAPRDALGEHDVVDGALPGQDRGSLGHEPEQALRAGGGRRLGADPDVAARRGLEIGDDPEERGLAAAGRADQGDELPGAHLQVHSVQRERLAEAAGDPADRDRQHGIRLRSAGRDAGRRVRTSRRRLLGSPRGQRLMPGLNPLVIISSAGTMRGICSYSL